MKQKNYWWQNQPLTIGACQADSKYGSDIDIFNQWVSQAGFNVEQLLHPFFPLGVEDMTFYDEAKHGGILDKYLENSKKTDVKLIIYTNTHAMCSDLANENPGYCQLDKEGKPYMHYSIFPASCINVKGPFHRKLIENVKALCKRDIGGIFFDGPIQKNCYCDVCRADFQEKYGHSIFDATEYELHEWRVDNVTAHIREAYKTIKSINPGIALYINNSALRADVTGSNTRKLYPYVDILGAEGGFYEIFYGIDMLWQTTAFMKHLECIIEDPIREQKPMVNFTAANDSGVSRHLKTEAETSLTYAHTLANGGNIWYGFHNDPLKAMHTAPAKKAKEYNQFILKNRDLFQASKTCARVAVMWSENTANYYATSVAYSDFTEAKESGYADRGDHLLAEYAIMDILLRSHIQFDVVDEMSLEHNVLDNYDTLILPSVGAMSDATAESIKTFVKNGGTVFGYFDVAMYDEKGNFEGKSKLADVFGLIGAPEIFKTTVCASCMFKVAEHPILASVESEQFIAASLDAKWKYADDVNVLCVAHPPMNSTYGEVPTERYPALVEHSYGKGKAYYYSGNFGERYGKRTIIEYRQILKGICDYTSRPVVECDDKGIYEVVLRRQENKFLLHLVNITGNMERPIHTIAPLQNLSFTIHLDGFGIDKDSYNIKTICGGVLQNCVQEGNRISFTLDQLKEYEIIVVE